MLIAPAVTRAADVDWDNGSGDSQWETPTNWSTDMVPVAPDDAVFINPAVGPAVIDNDIPAPRDIRFGSEGGRTGSGTVNHSAGTAAPVGWVRMGISAGSGGEYNLSGGTLEANRFNVAESAGSTGTFNVTGGTLRQRDVDPNAEPTWSRIGQDGAATFNVSGGTVSFDSRTLFGAAPTSTATATQTGGIVEVRRGDVTIADTGDATYTISAGTLRTLEATREFQVGQWDNGDGILNVSGTATVDSAGTMIVGNGNDAPGATNGTVNQTGGTVLVGSGGAGNLVLAARTADTTGTYNLSGGVLDLTGGEIQIGNGTGVFNQTGGTLRNASSVEGPVSVAGGTLNAGSDGTFGSATNIAGNLTVGPAGELEFDLFGTGSGDVLNVSGTADLGGGDLDLVIPGGTTLNPGDMFTILTSAGLTGTFANATEGTPFVDGGVAFNVDYDGNNVTLTVVPEPGTLGLALVGAAGLLLRRRRNA